MVAITMQQAKTIANCIAADIAFFISAHQPEYAVWLKNHYQDEGGHNNGKKKHARNVDAGNRLKK